MLNEFESYPAKVNQLNSDLPHIRTSKFEAVLFFFFFLRQQEIVCSSKLFAGVMCGLARQEVSVCSQRLFYHRLSRNHFQNPLRGVNIQKNGTTHGQSINTEGTVKSMKQDHENKAKKWNSRVYI